MTEKLKILGELTKIRITVFVTLTTVFGYICKAETIDTGIILPVIGILFLACGSAVINHIQERKTDALMERTKNRPLPSGRITLINAVMLAVVLSLIGVTLLMIGAGVIGVALGLLNLVWYNLIYTPLKKRNALAIIPGSLVGAIPPAVGWVAAGGYLLDPQIIILSFFFFIWQIPHFWLLLLALSKDYEKAGFPTLTKLFSTEQLARITFVWIASTAATAVLIPLFGVIKFNAVAGIIFLLGIWLTIKAVFLLKPDINKNNFGTAFREINIFVVLIIILLSIDKLLIYF
ncbi:MAG: protoheme IX farnesyltransferase [Bacteroidota bacterium]|nr:protoheme IX farnesyltransferase [Bacteroidota bacterium]